MHGMDEGVECGDGLRVWRPSGYDGRPGHRFPVVHLRGGLLTGGDAGVPAVVSTVRRLESEGALPPCLVVVHSSACGLSPGDAVRRIDRDWRTASEAAARMLVGASHDAAAALGGLIDEPPIVGFFGGLSTSFEGPEGAPPATSGLLRRLEEMEHEPGMPRIHLDHGDRGLDECYGIYHRHAADILRSKGWRDDVDFLVRTVAGGSHDPASWGARLGDALRFAAGQISR